VIATALSAFALACGAPQHGTHAEVSTTEAEVHHGSFQALSNDGPRVPGGSSPAPESPPPASPAPVVSAAPPSAEPFDYQPLPPGALVTFNLYRASAPEALRAMANVTGDRIVVSPQAEPIVRCASVTVYSPRRVTPAQARQLVIEALRSSGLNFRRTRDALVVERAPNAPPPQTCDSTATNPVAQTASPAPPTITDAARARVMGGIRVVSPTERSITNDAMDSLLEDQAYWFARVRIMPHTNPQGAIDGIQFFGVRADTVLAALGFQNGDVLRTINHLDVSTPDHALEAYARLRAADVLELEVLRNGAPVVLTVRRTAH
jgi:hypothetical protein